MSLLTKNNGNLRATLLEEIELLAKSPALDKSGMIGETFSPLNPEHCYMGQIFRQTSTSHSDTSLVHRQTVGSINTNNVFGMYRGYSMTPLEVWSAENWHNNKNAVMAVYDHIKSGGVTELPEITFE